MKGIWKKTLLVTAVDSSPRMLEIAKERTPDDLVIDYRQGNCENLNALEDKRFDLIVSNMVIQDLVNYEKAFQEMYRLLVEGGCFIFSFYILALLRQRVDGKKQKTVKSCIGT